MAHFCTAALAKDRLWCQRPPAQCSEAAPRAVTHTFHAIPMPSQHSQPTGSRHGTAGKVAARTAAAARPAPGAPPRAAPAALASAPRAAAACRSLRAPGRAAPGGAGTAGAAAAPGARNAARSPPRRTAARPYGRQWGTPGRSAAGPRAGGTGGLRGRAVLSTPKQLAAALHVASPETGTLTRA